MANYNTYNAASVVLIIAAICGIISFFSGWICIDNIGVDGVHLCFTGYGILDSDYSDVFEGFAYIPLYVLILSVLSLIIAFLPKMGVNVDAGKYGLMLIIIGLAILVFTLLFGLQNYDVIVNTEYYRDMGFNIAGEGLNLAIIAGILNILIGALPALTRRL